MPVLDSIPPRAKIDITEDKCSINLSAITSVGSEATSLARAFREQAAQRLDAHLTAARVEFLKSDRWQRVSKLRDRFAQLVAEARKAEKALHEAQLAYHRSFGESAESDPLTAAEWVQNRRIGHDNCARAVEDLRLLLTAEEKTAEEELRRSIEDAQFAFRQQARERYVRLLDDLVEAVKPHLPGLALSEFEALATVLPLNNRGPGNKGLSSEQLTYGSLPPREDVPVMAPPREPGDVPLSPTNLVQFGATPHKAEGSEFCPGIVGGPGAVEGL